MSRCTMLCYSVVFCTVCMHRLSGLTSWAGGRMQSWVNSLDGLMNLSSKSCWHIRWGVNQNTQDMCLFQNFYKFCHFYKNNQFDYDSCWWFQPPSLIWFTLQFQIEKMFLFVSKNFFEERLVQPVWSGFAICKYTYTVVLQQAAKNLTSKDPLCH